MKEGSGVNDEDMVDEERRNGWSERGKEGKKDECQRAIFRVGLFPRRGNTEKVETTI